MEWSMYSGLEATKEIGAFAELLSQSVWSESNMQNGLGCLDWSTGGERWN